MRIALIGLVPLATSIAILFLMWKALRTVHRLRQDLTLARQEQATLRRSVQALHDLVAAEDRLSSATPVEASSRVKVMICL
jgi:hypothetical protein